LISLNEALFEASLFFYKSGLNSGLCPMYINEIAPKRIRGSIGVLFQLGVTFSIFFSQIFGLPEIFGNQKLWALLLGKAKTFIEN